jgi:hypothetical protein
MILPFSTQMNGKPTYFVEKIHKGIRERFSLLVPIKPNNYSYQSYLDCYPKFHTMREDKKDRWKAGTKIDFFINCRQKDMFRFAPVLPVVSTQKVEIMWFNTFGTNVARVFIDDKSFACVKFEKEMIVTGKMLQLAQNDGFDTIEDFFAYFNEDFKGKIIHWTDLRY